MCIAVVIITMGVMMLAFMGLLKWLNHVPYKAPQYLSGKNRKADK
jgi:hypothetical protein